MFSTRGVTVRQVDDTNWEVVLPFSYSGAQQTFDIPAGMGTDFASVPRFFVWLLPRYGRYTLAAIVHDRLWRELVPAGQLTFIDADALFRRMLRELDVAFLRRWFMWAAVRWGALCKGRLGRHRWWVEAPRVLAVSVLAVPVVAPPTVLIGASLVAFYLLELGAWSILAVGRSVGKLFGRGSRKPLNRPKLLLRTDR